MRKDKTLALQNGRRAKTTIGAKNFADGTPGCCEDEFHEHKEELQGLADASNRSWFCSAVRNLSLTIAWIGAGWLTLYLLGSIVLKICGG